MVHRLSYFLIIAPCYVELFPQYFNCKTHTKNIVLLYYAVTLEVIMKFGYFDDPNREYVITTPETPLPWINYLGNCDFFSLISNTCGGYTFYRDARLLRLTRYRYNDGWRSR